MRVSGKVAITLSKLSIPFSNNVVTQFYGMKFSLLGGQVQESSFPPCVEEDLHM